MEQVLVYIIGFVILLVIEGFFSGLGLFSLIPLMAYFLMNKTGNKAFLVFFAVICIALDFGNHLFIGSYFSALVVGLIVIYLLQIMFPPHEQVTESAVCFAGFVSFHLILSLLASWKLKSHLGFAIVTNSLIAALIESAIFLGVRALGNLMSDRTGKKIRIK
jgi:hypothetical protein